MCTCCHTLVLWDGALRGHRWLAVEAARRLGRLTQYARSMVRYMFCSMLAASRRCRRRATLGRNGTPRVRGERDASTTKAYANEEGVQLLDCFWLLHGAGNDSLGRQGVHSQREGEGLVWPSATQDNSRRAMLFRPHAPHLQNSKAGLGLTS